MRRNFQSEISISNFSRRFALSYGISSWCHCLIFKNSAFLKPSLFLFIVEKSTSSSRTLGKVWNEFLEVQVHSVLSLQPISKLLLSPTISCRIIHESLFYLSRWTIDLNSSDSFAWDEVALRVTTWKSYSLREWFKVTTWMLHKQLMWLFNNLLKLLMDVLSEMEKGLQWADWKGSCCEKNFPSFFFSSDKAKMCRCCSWKLKTVKNLRFHYVVMMCRSLSFGQQRRHDSVGATLSLIQTKFKGSLESERTLPQKIYGEQFEQFGKAARINSDW